MAGQHRDRDRECEASLLLGFGDRWDPVHAALVLHLAVHPVAADQGRSLLDPPTEDRWPR